MPHSNYFHVDFFSPFINSCRRIKIYDIFCHKHDFSYRVEAFKFDYAYTYATERRRSGKLYIEEIVAKTVEASFCTLVTYVVCKKEVVVVSK